MDSIYDEKWLLNNMVFFTGVESKLETFPIDTAPLIRTHPYISRILGHGTDANSFCNIFKRGINLSASNRDVFYDKDAQLSLARSISRNAFYVSHSPGILRSFSIEKYVDQADFGRTLDMLPDFSTEITKQTLLQLGITREHQPVIALFAECSETPEVSYVNTLAVAYHPAERGDAV